MIITSTCLDDTNETQKDSFMFEITQMKQLGFHQNIVSLVGCCTFHEPKFLVIEYLPFGDLLQWLRRGRRMVRNSRKQYLVTFLSFFFFFFIHHDIQT